LIPKELAYLAPVVTADYSTGDPELDNIIEAFYRIHENTRKMQKPTEGESIENWKKKLNSLSETIRDLQVRRDVNTLIQKAQDLLHRSQQIIKQEVSDDEISKKLSLLHDLKEEALFFENI